MSSATPPPPPPPVSPAVWTPAWVPPRPVVPGSNAALVVGIVGLAGGFLLLLPLAAAPIAWYLGARAVRQAEREPERWAATGSARAGQILGMIGSGVLALLTLAAIVITTLLVVAATATSPY